MVFNIKDWRKYVLSFYGKGGIYEFNAGHDVIIAACKIVENRKDIAFDADTIDRESVAGILSQFGYELHRGK
tara:strand:+ start:2732 stop:2947 length:216 start_codon:yes stop_codon:yes gene_type:complete